MWILLCLEVDTPLDTRKLTMADDGDDDDSGSGDSGGDV